MIQLIYASSATQHMSEDDLLSLLNKARENNESRNITGMLLYVNGNFLQILEGEEKAVEDIYSTIEKDPRHTGCIVMKKDTIGERNFPQWSMGFKHLTRGNKDEIKGYSEFFDRHMSPEELVKKTRHHREAAL